MKAISELFWDADIEQLKQGNAFDQETGCFVCLACGQRFEKGVIYPWDGSFYEAEKFAQVHFAEEHTSVLDFLLGLDKKLTGLTDLQKSLIQYFGKGLTDGEIVKELGGGSNSTIRNHRFTLRERMKQAKVFLAIMELVEDKASSRDKLISIHRTATMLDQRYEITEQENEKILHAYFKYGLDGPLAEFPKKEKRKVAILRHLAKSFDDQKQFTEKEVNEILRTRFHDYVTLRRYLIEYGFLDRLPDGSKYWVKK